MGREGLRPIGIAGGRGRRLLMELLKCHGLFFFNSHWHNKIESCS